MMLRCAIVDDEPLALGLLESYVNKTPFLQLAGKYSSAVQAMKELPDEEVDLLFLDIQMPELDGYAATREIRQMDRPDAGTIPILAMTANAFDEDRKKALECGMNGFLSKPIVIEELISTLQNNLTD